MVGEGRLDGLNVIREQNVSVRCDIIIIDLMVVFNTIRDAHERPEIRTILEQGI